MTTALITGVYGQDGAYLSRRLLSEGCRVVGLKLEGPVPAALSDHLDGVELVDGDVTDVPAMGALLDAVRPDEVYNLAGLSSVAQSWSDPSVTAEVNGLAVVRLLELLRERAGSIPARFVQASSAEMFGNPRETPQRESTPLSPTSPYGLAKAFAHQYVGLSRNHFGLHASSLILYNHESPLRPTAFVTRKISAGVAAISRGRQDRLVMGSLDVTRDWGFAGDYVDAMVRAARHDVASDYVVATGVAHTLRELLDAAFARVGIADWSGLVTTDPAFVRPVEISSMVGDATKARDVLGWSPTTTFADLVAAMVDHDLALLDAD